MSRTNFVKGSMAHSKVHFTLYKAGKRWLTAGITVTAMGLALGAPHSVSAASVKESLESPGETTTAEAAQGNTVASDQREPQITTAPVVAQPTTQAGETNVNATPNKSAQTTATAQTSPTESNQTPVAKTQTASKQPVKPQPGDAQTTQPQPNRGQPVQAQVSKTQPAAAEPQPSQPTTTTHSGTESDTKGAYQQDGKQTDQANQQAKAANAAKAALQKLLDHPQPDDAQWTTAINQALKTYQTAATAFTGQTTATEQAVKDYEAAVAAYIKNGGPNQGAINQITPSDTTAKTDAAKLAAYEKQIAAVQSGLDQVQEIQDHLAAYKTDKATYAAAQQVIAANKQLTQTITGLNGAIDGIKYSAQAGDTATVTQLLHTLDLIKGEYDADVTAYQAQAKKFNQAAQTAADQAQAQHPAAIDTSSLNDNPTDQQYHQFTDAATTTAQNNQDVNTVKNAYADAQKAYQDDIAAPQESTQKAVTDWQQAADQYNQTIQQIEQQPNAQTDETTLTNQANAFNQKQQAAQDTLTAFNKSQSDYQKKLADYQTALNTYTAQHHLAHQDAGSITDFTHAWQQFTTSAATAITQNTQAITHNAAAYQQGQSLTAAFQAVQQKVTAINQAAQAQIAAADQFNKLVNQISTTGQGVWSQYNSNPNATNAQGQPVASDNIVALGQYLIDQDFAYLNAVYGENYKPDTKAVIDTIDSGAKITRTYVETHLYPGTAGRTLATLKNQTGSYANVVDGFNQALQNYTTATRTTPTNGIDQGLTPLVDNVSASALKFEQSINAANGFIAQFNQVSQYVADHSADQKNNDTLHQQIIDPNVSSTNGSTPNLNALMGGPKHVDINILLDKDGTLAGLAGAPDSGVNSPVYATGSITHPTNKEHPSRVLTPDEIDQLLHPTNMYNLVDGSPATINSIMQVNGKTYYLAGFYINQPTRVIPAYDNVNQLYVFRTGDPMSELKQVLQGFSVSTSNQDNSNIYLLMVPVDTTNSITPTIHATPVTPVPSEQINVGYTNVATPTAPKTTSPAPAAPNTPVNPGLDLHYATASDPSSVVAPTIDTTTVHLADAPTITLQAPKTPTTPGGNTPGQGGNTPGQGGNTPGQGGNTPGHGSNTPGGNTPGHGGNTSSGNNPGQPSTGTHTGQPHQAGQSGDHYASHNNPVGQNPQPMNLVTRTAQTQPGVSTRWSLRNITQLPGHQSGTPTLPQTGERSETGWTVLGAALAAFTVLCGWTLEHRKQRNA